MSVPAVSDAGAILVESDFAVPDIRCAGCISKLENGLVLNPLIAAARVNFTAKRVRVSHPPDARMPELVGAFNLLGFEAHAVDASPMDPSANDSRNLLKAMAIAGFAMMNIMLLSVSVWSGATGVTRDMFHWLSALIALPTIAYSGQPFFRSAWRALRHRQTNMDVPISIGVLLATALSLYETIISGPHAYFDSAVMLLFFLLTGRWLDSVMRDRARSGVTSLLQNMGTGALVLDEQGRSEWHETHALEPGMVMLVGAGERLAADGVVIKGQSSFDLSLLTGESAPQQVDIGASVHAGTLNLGAPVEIRITKTGADTIIADIARLMGEAAQSKSLYVRIADRAARYYAPAVHSLALLSFAGWMLMGTGWHHSLLIAVAVLIITCPCALGLAVPAAQIVVAGALMRAGILVKDGSAIERIADVDLALFDKTGTLTLGRPEPENLDQLDAPQKSILLALAQASRHPLSEAIRRTLQPENIKPAMIDALAETPGFGMSGLYKGQKISLGRPDGSYKTDGLATVLCIEDEAPFIVHFADRLRPDASETIETLHQMQVSAQILSGDRAASVAPIARALGLFAQTSMLPRDKLDAIARQTATGHKVLMLGDGLNDGPALAAGYASMAPGSASDAGKNAADLIFLGDSLKPVAIAIRAARRTQAIVRQNFALAIGYNIIAVPLAILGQVTPLIAALAMSGSSIIVVANAMRLRGAAQ